MPNAIASFVIKGAMKLYLVIIRLTINQDFNPRKVMNN